MKRKGMGLVLCLVLARPTVSCGTSEQGADLIAYPHMIQPLANKHFRITTGATEGD